MFEDITFCGNMDCSDMKCHRNPKHIRVLDIPHSFGWFNECPKWNDAGALWLTKEMNKEKKE